MAKVPEARVQLLNHRLRSPLLETLAPIPGLYFDTARVEGTDGVPNLVSNLQMAAFCSAVMRRFSFPKRQ